MKQDQELVHSHSYLWAQFTSTQICTLVNIAARKIQIANWFHIYHVTLFYVCCSYFLSFIQCFHCFFVGFIPELTLSQFSHCSSISAEEKNGNWWKTFNTGQFVVIAIRLILSAIRNAEIGLMWFSSFFILIDSWKLWTFAKTNKWKEFFHEFVFWRYSVFLFHFDFRMEEEGKKKFSHGRVSKEDTIHFTHIHSRRVR